ncbi:MAG: thioredoxin family protein [Myxococcales bacterium]|nr:thioredoxin family protein [Myxococcales bacterium]
MRTPFLLLLAVACGAEPVAEPPSTQPPEAPAAPAEERVRAPSRDSDHALVYVLREDQELRETLQGALRRARERDARLLIVFGAEWCPDCRQVAMLLTQAPAADALREGYEVVHVNVGRFDRHRDLLARYRVERISTLVVLDGQARRVAQTTLEPISHQSGLTPTALAAWLRDPQDPWRRSPRDPHFPEPPPGAAPDSSPLFPPELLGE